jgi:hypothetical protein
MTSTGQNDQFGVRREIADALANNEWRQLIACAPDDGHRQRQAAQIVREIERGDVR